MELRNLLAMAALVACPAMMSAQHDIKDGAWQIKFDENSKTLTYTQNGVDLVRNAYVALHK